MRPAQPRDTPGIQKLIGEIFRDYDCTLDAVHEDTHLLAPGEYFRARGGEFWVAVDERNEVRATVAVMQHGAKEIELKSLYVHPDLRRQGWGERLSDMIIEYARVRNCARVALWSDTRFTAAHRLYTRMGFRQLNTTRDLNDSNHSVEYGFVLELPAI